MRIRRKTFSKREKVLFALAMGIFAAAVILQTGLYVHSVFTRLDGAIARAERERSLLQTTLSHSKNLVSEYETILANFHNPKDTDTLIQEIESIARKQNMNVLNIKAGATRDEGTYRTFTVKIESQSDVAACARFLYTLTERFNGIAIERLQVQEKYSDEAPRINLSLAAVAFKE